MRYYYYRTFNYRAQYQNTNKYPVDSINDGEFLKLLLDKNKVAEEDIKLTVSTQIIVESYNFGFFGKKKTEEKHILFLDIDTGAIDMTRCIAYLNDHKIGYAVIESSPNRFWLIADYVGTFNEVCVQYQELSNAYSPRCVDQKYIDMARQTGQFDIRATPKPRDYEYPKLPFRNSLKNKYVVKWYKEFTDHWDSSTTDAIRASTMTPEDIKSYNESGFVLLAMV